MKRLIFLLPVFAISFSFGQGRPDLLADSSRPGAMSAADKKKIDKIEVVSSISELKNITNRRTDVMYRLMNQRLKNVSELYWSPNSTADDDSVMVFKIPGVATGRYLRYYEEIYVEWFGAIPDDETDDSQAFQKAINFAVKNAQSAKLKCKGGVFNVKNLVVSNYINGNANYVAFTLEGVAPAYDGVSVAARMTELRTNDGTAFTICIQKGLNVSIKNISFRGAGPLPDGVDQLVRWTDKDWNKNGQVRDNPLSPHAGIVIDAFLNTVTGADQYPGARSWYSNAGRTGSSCVLMDGCAVRNYNVGIMISPAPGTTNADNISFQNGVQVGNKTFWASGQTQSRSNSIVNLYSFGAVQYLINCRDYGNSTGTPPTVLNSSIAGGTKYLYKTFSNFGSVRFVNTYMESLWSLGWHDGEFPAVFENCDINLEYGNTFSSPVLAQGGPVHFRGGYLAYFDNIYAQGFTFANQYVSFDGTTIKGGVPINFSPPSDYYGPVGFDNVTYSNAEGGSLLRKGNFESQARRYLHNFVIPEMTLKGIFDISYKSTDNYFEQATTEQGVTIKTNTVNHTGYFITSNPRQYAVNNYLTTNIAVDYTNDIYNPSRTGLGWVSAIRRDTVVLSYVPFGLETGKQYFIYNARMLKFLPRMTGTLTAGSITITDIVSAGDGKPVAGEYIKATGLALNTRVVSVASNTITISQPAKGSGSNVEFYDARIQATGIHGGNEFGYDSPFWYFGDIIKNDDPQNPALDYIRITAAGAVGSARPPKMVYVKQPQ